MFTYCNFVKTISSLLWIIFLINTSTAQSQKPFGAPCSSDAECSLENYLFCNGTCKCSVPDPKQGGTCLPWKSTGESCNQTFECSRRLSLTCVKGTCNCDPSPTIENDQEYFFSGYRDILRGECLSKPGQRCSTDRSDSAPGFTGIVCTASSSCILGVCKCFDVYTLTKSGLCGRIYGRPCSKIDVCADELRCTTDNLYSTPTCNCPNPDYQEYDHDTSSCRGTLNSACNLNNTNSCAHPSVCTETSAGPRCRCGNGTVESTEGKCEIQHGFRCDYENPTNRVFCNQKAKLVCKNNLSSSNPGDLVCSCPNDSDVFESDKNRCASPLGVRCKVTKVDADGGCISSRRCQMKDGYDWGVCQ